MSKIKSVKSREILDSRGNPTLETTVSLEDNSQGISSVPSGASVGSFEALELRDNNKDRFFGMGVSKAVNNAGFVIGKKIIGIDAASQDEIDNLMISLDGTANKSNLGANSILSVSLAAAKACSESQKIPLFLHLNNLAKKFGINIKPLLPTPIFNLINGGKHGAGNLDFQEFHVIPANYLPFPQKVRIGAELYQVLKKLLIFRNAIHSVGDEGGFAPNFFTNVDAFEILMSAIKQTPYEIGNKIFLGLDVAASYFYKNGSYIIKDKPAQIKANELVDFYVELDKSYKLLLLEDGLYEDDWDGWEKLTDALGHELLIVGDDLIATNPFRLDRAIKENACNAIVVKPNQIGTLTETFGVIKKAKEAKMKTILSHRSGETNDTFIADLSVAVASEYTKFGAPARGERVAKYNRLLEISDLLSNNTNTHFS